MAKRGVFFQLYLNPRNPRDEQIIKWLTAIPRFQRSQHVKNVLSRAIHGDGPATERAYPEPTRPEAGRLASKLLGSLPKRRT